MLFVKLQSFNTGYRNVTEKPNESLILVSAFRRFTLKPSEQKNSCRILKRRWRMRLLEEHPSGLLVRPEANVRKDQEVEVQGCRSWQKSTLPILPAI